MPVSAPPTNIFNVVQRGMSAQMVRMNAAASNLANAGSVAGSEEEAYRPLRAVFAEDSDRRTGLSSVSVQSVTRADVAPVKRHEPGHPLADANGDIWASPVSETAEMVEMMESARQYQNLVEAMQTAKQLMLDTMRMK
ncbi:Flagellar basal-body rod protein [Alteripontixanthobacter maritimus]|uniref:Flagellar basal-body rod protein FlgC n=1 Tax=Alteripontixanthobacter maritimus TaxID=2161824 RepID=A0A369Q7L2_9SPHN|nr:Flagellar basal-body rod protein [Alteripontixanthobacter maritimus]